jgi:hypothetical protein
MHPIRLIVFPINTPEQDASRTALPPVGIIFEAERSERSILATTPEFAVQLISFVGILLISFLAVPIF